MSRAPIMSGTRKLPKPARIGTTTRKTIAVPCTVKSSLYLSPVMKSWSGLASWSRMSSASSPAMAKNTRLVTM